MVNTVLLIEDNADDAYYHRWLIEQTGMVNDVEVYEDPNTALDRLKEAMHLKAGNGYGSLPEHIFVDINLSGADGWDFIKDFSNLGLGDNQISLSVLTGSLDPEVQAKALSSGAVRHFFIKPMQKVEIAEHLSGIIKRQAG